MRRIVVKKPGGHEALELVESPDPVPGPGQVLVRVKNAGVNYADCLVRMGLYSAAKGLYPVAPGFEFAGSIDDEPVFGITRFGAYSDRVAVPKEQIWPCPEGWSPADCAALPATALTAYHGLMEVARVRPGETVLIHSAAGGMGCALVQMCRILGLKSIAVVGSRAKVRLPEQLGADRVLVRSSKLWSEVEEGVDVIFDANGVSTLRPGFEHLAPNGRLVVYGFAEMLPRAQATPSLLRLLWNRARVPSFSPLELTAGNKTVAGFNVVHLFHRIGLARKAMSDILAWIRDGKYKKVPVKTFPAEQAGKAHQELESGRTVGKLVLAF
ncbi:MAG: zinc-binding dehydrogenase [Elusimicrobiota bacterium]